MHILLYIKHVQEEYTASLHSDLPQRGQEKQTECTPVLSTAVPYSDMKGGKLGNYNQSRLFLKRC